MNRRMTRRSTAALTDARAWLAGHYGVEHALSMREVIESVEKHYPGGWDAFVTERRQS